MTLISRVHNWMKWYNWTYDWRLKIIVLWLNRILSSLRDQLSTKSFAQFRFPLATFSFAAIVLGGLVQTLVKVMLPNRFRHTSDTCASVLLPVDLQWWKCAVVYNWACRCGSHVSTVRCNTLQLLKAWGTPSSVCRDCFYTLVWVWEWKLSYSANVSDLKASSMVNFEVWSGCYPVSPDWVTPSLSCMCAAVRRPIVVVLIPTDGSLTTCCCWPHNIFRIKLVASAPTCSKFLCK